MTSGAYGGVMPNLVVYVPADVARALEAKGVSEDIQRRACKEVLVGLADGGLGGGEVARAAGPSDRPTPSQSAAAASPPPSSQCVRFKFHHTNHSGKPCPECNYPLEGAVT